ncbi:type I methionyl aminopeptidase [Candidatus Roizmanbacteria bacterium]|nr:type I methionyl aminopeptidase [Candidatus Roizmanbacteria bacterium]
MIHYKTKEEIEIMKEGGKRLRAVVDELMPWIQEGMTTQEVDRKAEELIIKQGGSSSFKRVPGYTWTTCVPIGDQVVHTRPSKRILKKGEVLTVDIGVFYKGFHTDYADTIVIGGETDEDTKHFLQVGKNTLEKAIAKAKPGNHLGEISKVIEDEIYGHGYFTLHDLTGHGIGRDLHEDPYVFGYVEKPVEKTIVMKPGLVIAIEIIYSKGSEDIAHEKGDSWSLVTKDGSLSACFEKTVALTDKNAHILT